MLNLNMGFRGLTILQGIIRHRWPSSIGRVGGDFKAAELRFSFNLVLIMTISSCSGTSCARVRSFDERLTCSTNVLK